MSRIGKMPIPLPEKVQITVKPGSVEVTGPLGKMAQVLPPHTVVKVDKNQVLVELEGLNDEEGGALQVPTERGERVRNNARTCFRTLSFSPGTHTQKDPPAAHGTAAAVRRSNPAAYLRPGH